MMTARGLKHFCHAVAAVYDRRSVHASVKVVGGHRPPLQRSTFPRSAWLGAVLVLGLAGSLYAAQNVNVGLYDRVHIVPAPGKVTIDGDLSDWDKSGGFFSYRFDEDKSRRNLTGYMMYDADNLYIGAHVGDPTPMMNAMNPESEASVAWQGDCLQVRLSTDPKLGYPLKGYLARKDATSTSEGLVLLTMWYYTPKAQPCLQIYFGMDMHGSMVNPEGFQGAYKKDADGRGYTLEYALPWKLLHCEKNPPKGGDPLACVWQVLWSDDRGRVNQFDLSEIRNPDNPGMVYQDPGCWGRAVYEKTGHLPAGTVVARSRPVEKKPETGFFAIRYTVPGRDKAKISMQIYDGQGHTIRWLLGDAERPAGANQELWNGLDNDGNPVPPGRYTVKWCYFHDVHGKLLATADNPGNPPWNTSDNTGSWAGDYRCPVAVTANKTHLFLAHWWGEASRNLIKVTPQGQRVWGIDGTGDLTPGVIGICNDGQSLYLLQGDPLYGAKPGFVKISCETGFQETIGKTGRAYVPAFGLDGGITNHVSGIAVNQDAVFVSSEDAGQVRCFDKQTGQQTRIIDKLNHPRGLAFGPDGQLYVAAGSDVIAMNSEGGARRVAVNNQSGLGGFLPQQLAIATNGDIFVSVWGMYQQVMRFARDGQLLNEIGRRGGMCLPGPWVKEAMLQPNGLCIAPDGKLWVAEENAEPKRTSVWTQDGGFVREYIGPSPYSAGSVLDPEDPDFVYTCNTKFQMDFKTGQSWPVAVVFEAVPRQLSPIDGVSPIHGGEPQFIGMSGSGFGYYRFIHYQGRRFVYLAHTGANGAELDEMRGDRLYGLVNEPHQYNLLATDRNQDGRIQPSELQVLPSLANGTDGWWDDHLTYYFSDFVHVWKLPLAGFDANGVPRYDVSQSQLLLTKYKDDLAKNPGAVYLPWEGKISSFMVDADGNLYLLWNSGETRIKRGEGYLDKGHRLVKFIPNPSPGLSPKGRGKPKAGDSAHTISSPPGGEDKGEGDSLPLYKLAWEYRNIVVDFYSSWNTTLSKPGEIVGSTKFNGELGRYLAVAAYYGQYIILDKETGLYITAFTPDTRTEPPLNEMGVFTENFNGSACYSPKLKKYLYCGGDANARVWEILGLDDVKFRSFTIEVSAHDTDQARSAMRVEYGLAQNTRNYMVKPLPLPPTIDGNLSEWAGADWVEFGVDDSRKARAALSWKGAVSGSQPQLFLAFDVTDSSPMQNRGGDNQLLFKTGDAVEFCVSSAAADVERKDDKPLTGDKRILISMVQDKPIVMLYEPKSALKDKTPGSFVSSVAREDYDHVAPLQKAQAAIQRRADGYTVEVAFDARELGFSALDVGQKLRGDFGVLFSDKGGAITLTRAMWADDSPDIGVNNDIPTESRIHPKRWGWLMLR